MKANIIQLIKNNKAINFAKKALLLSFTFSSLLCIIICLLFAGYEVTVDEASVLFIKTFAVTWLYILIFKAAFSILVWAIENAVQLKPVFSEDKRKAFFIGTLAVAVSLMICSCNAQDVSGINKDLNTGMTTTYHGIKTQKTMVIMNKEILNHNQIPLGESFTVVNDKIEGLTVKDNKVSIGCSLIITDSTGKELLNEPDLFKDGGIYKKSDAEYLKCTVSTGKPMEWDKDYKVAIKFWDKYGKGTIENNFTISTIDIP